MRHWSHTKWWSKRKLFRHGKCISVLLMTRVLHRCAVLLQCLRIQVKATDFGVAGVNQVWEVGPIAVHMSQTWTELCPLCTLKTIAFLKMRYSIVAIHWLPRNFYVFSFFDRRFIEVNQTASWPHSDFPDNCTITLKLSFDIFMSQLLLLSVIFGKKVYIRYFVISQRRQLFISLKLKLYFFFY